MNKENIQDKTLEKFMKDYLQNESEAREKAQKEELIVNFDISYPDGQNETFVCGENSEIFGHEEGCIQNHIEPEVMKCYLDDTKIDLLTDFESDDYKSDNYKSDDYKGDDYNSSNYNSSDYNSDEFKNDEFKSDEFKSDDFENDDYGSKWINCEEEITEKIHKDKKGFTKGEITVFSTLQSIDGTKIKGVKVNLYKINGICPELVASSETDCNGRVIFTNIPEGNYRVIQSIDKRYFNKPTYVNWNEVSIDCHCNKFTIFVVNSINEKCICKRKNRC